MAGCGWVLLQAQRRPASRMDAADAVAGNRALYARLFRNFRRLGEAARQYGVSSAGGGGYGHVAAQLGKASGDVRAPYCTMLGLTHCKSC